MVTRARPGITHSNDMRARDLANRTADLVLGACCPGCQEPGLGLCAWCRGALALPPFPIRRTVPGFPRTVVAGEYREVLKGVILAAKERGSLGMVPVLGELLGRSLALLLLTEVEPVETPVLLVPVPTARDHAIERGLDLTSALAARAARSLRTSGLTVESRALLRLTGRPLDQSELRVADRIGNVRGAFELSVRPDCGSIVVLDDVVTTGATLAEAALACRRGGLPPLGAVAVAGTKKRGGAR